MKRYLLDGNIFDEILVDQESEQILKFSVENGFLELLITWIVADEVAEIPKPEIKEGMETLISELKVKNVPLAGLLLDRAKLEQTLFIPWSEAELLEQAISSSINDENDMAIAMTAKSHNAVLVTNDKRLLNKAPRLIRVEALDWFEFLEACKAITKNLPKSLPNHRDRDIADR